MRSDQLPSIDAFVNRFNRLFKPKESSGPDPISRTVWKEFAFESLDQPLYIRSGVASSFGMNLLHAIQSHPVDGSHRERNLDQYCLRS